MTNKEAPKDWGVAKMVSRAKRAYNREESPKRLNENGIKFESKHNGGFLYVYPGIWFWPGTGLWRVPGSTISGRGVYSLIRYIKRTQLPGDTQTTA